MSTDWRDGYAIKRPKKRDLSNCPNQRQRNYTSVSAGKRIRYAIEPLLDSAQTDHAWVRLHITIKQCCEWNSSLYINLINNYEGTGCRLIHGVHLTNRFEDTGVRQGCLLSPFLFLSVINWIMKACTTQRRKWNPMGTVDATKTWTLPTIWRCCPIAINRRKRRPVNWQPSLHEWDWMYITTTEGAQGKCMQPALRQPHWKSMKLKR